MATTWDTVSIIGVGLIGGSIGLALRGQGLARRIVGIGRREESLRRALKRRAVTETTLELEQGVAQADFVVICAPVERIPDIARRVASSCPASSVITDAGSTKAAIMREVSATAVPGQAPFVGSHPLAGSEKAGVLHAREDLFVGRTVVVTPADDTPEDATRRVRVFWTSLGAHVMTLTAPQHDEAVAATSHLPHLVASALAASTPQAYLPLVATGWLDTTRIAAGDVELWRQILRQNRDSVLQSLRQFEKVLDSFSQALQSQDDRTITELLATGKQRRDALAD